MADQNRIVRIVLQAVDQASGALKGVQSGLVKFTGDVKQSFKNLGNEFEQLISSKIVQFFGVAGLAGAVKKSWEELDRLEASQRKLAGTAKITGVSLDALTALAARAKDQFKLSTVQSNDFAVELAKLATKAGDVGQAAPGLDAFLNIGAARGLTAKETLKAVQQAILGIDEGTDKLFNKNPSVLYDEFATKIGTTAGKLTDQQKAQALLNAAMDDGAKVGGAYNDFLRTTAGRQEQARVAADEAAAAFGRATAGLRAFLLDVATKAVGAFDSFIGGIQLLAVDASYWFSVIGPAAKIMAGNVLRALSELIGESRVVLTIFGDAATDVADRLGNAGVQMVTDAERTKRNLVTARREMYDEVLREHGIGEQRATTVVVAQTTARTKAREAEAAAAKKAAKESAESAAVAAAGLDGYTPKVKATTKAVEELRDTSVSAFPTVAKKTDEVVEKAKALIPAFRDGADAIKLLHEPLGQAVDKAVGLADALLRVKGDPSALVGVVANMVGIFQGLFGADGNRAARETLRKHQEAIEANTRSILASNSPGRTYAAAGRAADRLFDPTTLAGLTAGFGVLDPGKLAGFLSDFGLTLRDLDDLAKDFGLEGQLRGKGGAFNVEALGRLFDFIRRATPNQFGQDFGSQLDFITRGLNLGAIDSTRQFQTFGDLANRFGVTGITDLLDRFDLRTDEGRTGATDALRQLFRDLNAGTVDAASFGRLSGSEFVTLLEKFIGILSDPEQVFDGLIPTNPNRPPIVDGLGDRIGGGDVLPNDPIVKPVTAMVDLLASIDDHLGGFTESVTRYFGMDPAGGLAGTSTLAGPYGGQVHVGAITLNVSTASGQSPEEFGRAALDAIQRGLATELQWEYAARGSAVRS